MKSFLEIGTTSYTLDQIIPVWKNHIPLRLSEELSIAVRKSRSLLEARMQDTTKPIYGINTGFGSLCNQIISDSDLDQLQYNLVRSHACGSGNPVSEEISRLVLLLKIISLSKGNSAIRLETLEFLIELYNLNLIPVMPKYGSLGASGDLAPLAHLSLTLIGEGFIWNDNTPKPSAEIFISKNIKFHELKAKEGLALLNGTQYSLALLIASIAESRNLLNQSNWIAALSIEAFDCSLDFLKDEIHVLRNQKGQREIASTLLNILKSSDLENRVKTSVQDPYSFRCIPQVHGASLDVLEYVSGIAERELNAVTDNPLLLSDGSIISGGNFHAQPLALASDFLSIAMAELGSISERRIYQLINGSRGLPDFLTSNPGLNSGYMIVQYSAASLVNQNKLLSNPASIDSLVTSKGQEDHVSMAANAGLKCFDLTQNLKQIFAMEWMCAYRAWHFRKGWKCSSSLESLIVQYKHRVPFIEEDHNPSLQYLETIDFLAHVLSESGS